MNVVIMSEPNRSLADLLIKSDVSALICVTEDDVHIRSSPKGVVSGVNINCSQPIEVDIPKLKAQILQAYPLIDRWVSRNQSISTSIGLLLEYTVDLIQIIGNNSPRFAVLETGAPHHLFTYCVDVALNYLKIKVYYLYGNAFDGRCLIVEGIQKKTMVHLTDYTAGRVIDDYVSRIQQSVTYTPQDSRDSLDPVLHKSRVYVIFRHLRFMFAQFRLRFKKQQFYSDVRKINLKLPFIGFFQLISIMSEQRKYLAMLKAAGIFDLSQIQPDDVVYVGHMLPEATRFPESPNYPDEIDVLIDLKSRFPQSKIFYREHPAIKIFSEFGHIHFQGLHKNSAFYREMERIGVAVIPNSLHISDIRDRRCLFATKTGRVAVENSVLGIPTIVYGFPFYGVSLPLTSHVSSLTSHCSVESIKNEARVVVNPVELVQSYLVPIFSGSIVNPGISVAGNPNMRAEFELTFVRLIEQLAIETAV